MIPNKGTANVETISAPKAAPRKSRLYRVPAVFSKPWKVSLAATGNWAPTRNPIHVVRNGKSMRGAEDCRKTEVVDCRKRRTGTRRNDKIPKEISRRKKSFCAVILLRTAQNPPRAVPKRKAVIIIPSC